MTAPTSMPVMPAVARASAASGGSSAAGSSDGAPAFASALDTALDDALTGGGSAAGRTSGADADQPGDGAGKTADDAAVAAAVAAMMPAGLWALLSAVTPLTTAPTGLERTTSAAELIGAVTGTGPTAAAPVVLDTTAAALGTTAAGADPGLVPGTPAAPAASAAAPATTATTATTATSTATAAPAAPAAATATPTATPMTTPAAPPLAGTAPAIADLPRDAGLTVVLDPTPAPAAAPVVPAADADATVSTDAAGTTDLVAAPAPAFGDSPDTGSDGTTGDPETGMAAPAEPTPAADTDSLFTVSGPASVTPADPVAEAAPAAPAGDDAPVATQLGRQFAVLRNAPDGSQTMTVVITPETLGPVTVQVTVTDGSLDLTLHGASEAGRHALLDALPELRRELESAGLTFTRLEVDTSNRDAGAGLRNPEQQLLDARAGQHGSSGQPGQQESRARTWSSAPDRLGAGSAALTTSQSTSSGVDVRV